jgi:two-component system LytT family response regulator
MNTPWKTMIIDDESLARTRLRRLLSGFADKFIIVGEANNGDMAFELVENLKPEIIFLDVQMPGKNVFDMLSELHHKPFVIFCTAFDHYSLKAFDSLSLDYLIKPVEVVHLKRVINKIESITEQLSGFSIKSVIDAIDKFETKKSPTSITHKVGDKTILVKLDKVVFFHAEDRYVNFFNVEGIKYLSDQSLKYLEEKLPENFIRISKSIILNTSYVLEFHKYFRGRVIFVMDDLKKSKIISGGAYSEIIKRHFDF